MGSRRRLSVDAMALPMKKSMKGMKGMKAMKVSKIAKGKHARAVVFAGRKEKTKTGIRKSDLMKNESGKIVTKKSHANGKKNYRHIAGWTKAVSAARKALGLTGFIALNSGAKGKALYAKAKELFSK